MDKNSLMLKLRNEKLIAVIRGNSKEEVMKIVEAVYSGGIKFMEITFTIPQANVIIGELSEKYKDNNDIIIGAGTCIDSISARIAILAGAKFIVSPHLDVEILKLCNSYKIPCFSGATTVKDMVEALKYGAEVIKLFPADTYGPKGIKSFKGPLPQAEFMPTGGVSCENVKEWLKNGAIAVGTGGNLTKGAATNDFEAVKREAEKLVNVVMEYKNEN